MSDNVKVTTLKGFNNGDDYAPRNTVITVTEQRARELERNVLVTREEKSAPAPKSAPEPKNKKASEPKNKAASKGESKAD